MTKLESDPLEQLREIAKGYAEIDGEMEDLHREIIAAWERERADRGPTDFKFEVIRAAVERIEGEMRAYMQAMHDEYGAPLENKIVLEWADALRAAREPNRPQGGDVTAGEYYPKCACCGLRHPPIQFCAEDSHAALAKDIRYWRDVDVWKKPGPQLDEWVARVEQLGEGAGLTNEALAACQAQGGDYKIAYEKLRAERAAREAKIAKVQQHLLGIADGCGDEVVEQMLREIAARLGGTTHGK